MLNRKTKENMYLGVTYASAFFSLGVLLMIIGFVFVNGFKLLNFDLITHNYTAVTYISDLNEGYDLDIYQTTKTFDQDTYYSEKWGLALTDDTNLQGKNVIVVTYVDPESPLKDLNNKGVGSLTLSLTKDYEIIRIAFDGSASALSSRGAQNMITLLDLEDDIRELEFQTTGGGIRGSILTTIYLIGLTLIFALPIGIGAAIYLNEYAKNNKFNRLLRTFIETLTGVPSIIYGLMGLAIFVPITIKLTSATTGNLISGSMTLAVILLPIIIRTTEESLKVVPDDYRFASLALGASKTQTVFKVILPSAFSGILTATLLAIGRIIGESAALVFAIGVSIKDEIHLTDRSTSLAVHIWSMMTDEPANIELSSTIAIIILMMVLILNISVKLISKRFMRKFGVVQ
ncbi:MAG: phosphate ABC transporter permease PstA [Acholeplasmataceae bacterium]|nr:phosphate ABC transporter permease PstA [Acholeplasmataceae bacterium]